jgi:hypothetical protein
MEESNVETGPIHQPPAGKMIGIPVNASGQDGHRASTHGDSSSRSVGPSTASVVTFSPATPSFFPSHPNSEPTA